MDDGPSKENTVGGEHGADPADDAAPSVEQRGEPGAEPADAALIRRARQRHGTLGAVVAGGMLGIDKVLGRPAKEEIPAVWESTGEPLDIDGSGISVDLDDERQVHSHPQGATPRRIVKRRRTAG